VDEMQGKSDEQAIRTLYTSWFGAMERGDVRTLLSLVTPDVIVKIPASPPIVGREALRKSLHAFTEAFTETVKYAVEETAAQGDLAFARVTEQATIRSRTDGSTSSVHGMHLAILKRQPDGAWLIARDISSLNSSE
jgi:uncharacterized protein (TIGR02246 family)